MRDSEPDDSPPDLVPPSSLKGLPAEVRRHLGDVTHEMSNSLAYVVTNLNLLSEELSGDNPRIDGIVSDALEGSERLGDLVRTLRQVAWGVDTPNPPAERGNGTPEAAHILVVDDEEAILTAVRRALRSHTVTVAANGNEALQRIQEEAYDLVLCDLMMPGMTGMELYRTLTESDDPMRERLVFMTAGGFTSDVRHFLASVTNGVLHKPFDVKTLRWVVSQKLREQRARQSA
jgi:CheY-like chemotaxis protein